VNSESPKATQPPKGFSGLRPFQAESVAFFVHVASTISMPKSLGEIYGLLFSTKEPLSLDDIIERLQISRGSASEGTRWLRDIGAVQLVVQPGVRKDHFTAEVSLRRLAAGILRNQIEPHVESGKARLQNLRDVIGSDDENRDFEVGRVNQINNWYTFLKRALPAVKALAARF